MAPPCGADHVRARRRHAVHGGRSQAQADDPAAAARERRRQPARERACRPLRRAGLVRALVGARRRCGPHHRSRRSPAEPGWLRCSRLATSSTGGGHRQGRRSRSASRAGAVGGPRTLRKADGPLRHPLGPVGVRMRTWPAMPREQAGDERGDAAGPRGFPSDLAWPLPRHRRVGRRRHLQQGSEPGDHELEPRRHQAVRLFRGGGDRSARCPS